MDPNETYISIDSALMEKHMEEVIKLQSDLKKANEENHTLKQNLEESVENRNSMQSKVIKVQSDLIKANEENHILKHNLEEGEESRNSMQSKVIKMQSDLIKANEENRILKQNLEESEENRNSMQSKVIKVLSDLKQANEENHILRQNLKESEENRNSIQSILHENLDEFSGSERQRKMLEQYVKVVERDSKLFKKQNEDFQFLMEESESKSKALLEKLTEATRELQICKDEQIESNNMWNAKYGKLNSQYLKLQSESQRYKSNENAVQLVELQQQLQKLTTEIDATAYKFTKEAQNKKRPADNSELEIMKLVCEQNIKMLALHKGGMSNRNFLALLKAYKDLCEHNDENISDAMEKLRIIRKDRKLINKNLNTELGETLDKIKLLIEKCLKETADLKQKTFVSNFKHEETLYSNLSKAYKEIKLMSKSVPNNLHMFTGEYNLFNYSVSSENISKTNILKTDSASSTSGGWSFSRLDNYNENALILHNFPENKFIGTNSDNLDLINVKYHFAKVGLDDLENITVQRLPTANNRNIRPLIITLSNSNAVNKILGCSYELAKDIPHIGVARFNGKM